MSRSLKKGPFVDPNILKKMARVREKNKETIKTWSRKCTITPEMLGFTFMVHNGKQFLEVKPTEEMVGHKLGEFSPSTKFSRHGGRMQKDMERKAKDLERDKAKAAKAEQ